MQAREMLQCFTSSTIKRDQRQAEDTVAGETDATIQGVRTIAINVLGFVGYGSQKPWGQSSLSAPPGYHLSYMDSILAVVQNLIPAALVPARLLTSPVMPKSVQNIGFAVTEFPAHVKDLLQAERASKVSDKVNLMSTLVKASDAKKDEQSSDPKVKLSLTEEELAGNLFQFTVAGFDTTANTMAYAITLLATYPEWQNWICEELDEKHHSEGIVEYNRGFPVLKRCLALMASLSLAMRLKPRNHTDEFLIIV